MIVFKNNTDTSLVLASLVQEVKPIAVAFNEA